MLDLKIRKLTINNSFDPKAPANISFNHQNKTIKHVSYYTPDDKIYFDSELPENIEIVDPTIGVATLGMGGLSLAEGVGTYFGNNFIALAGLLNLEDEAMGAIDNLGSNWSTLFENDGVFGALNDMSMIKYNDEAWKTGSEIGHAIGVGTGRYLCDKIPAVGPVISSLLTYGDGYGSAYRHASESGSDHISSKVVGVSNGLIQMLSFKFSNIGGNIAIGTGMPFAETFIQTVSEPNAEGSFQERFSKNFDNNGGMKAVIISATMYGLNAKASNVKTVQATSELVAKDAEEATKLFKIIKTEANEAFNTPFITTALNTVFNSMIPYTSDLSEYMSSVPSVRPI